MMCSSPPTTWLGHYLHPNVTDMMDDTMASYGGTPESCQDSSEIFGFKVSPRAEGCLSLLVPLFLGIFLGTMLNTSVNEQGQPRRRNKKSLRSRLEHLFSALKFLMVHGTAVQEESNFVNAPVMKPNYKETPRESGVDAAKIPKHIAVIMDGNRRYGRRHYGKGSLGHLDGGKKAIEFIEWCSTEGIQYVTLYAFSSENWNRSKAEVDTLMALFERFIREDLRPIIHNRKIKFNHLFTGRDKIPARLLEAVDEIEKDSKDFGPMELNVCMSYGSRSEIMNATRRIADSCVKGQLKPDDIDEAVFSDNLTTAGMPEPEIMLRTSGEYRISNFLLWQCAYSEFFFADCDWPELEKEDLLDVMRQYANGRSRRYGL